VDKYTFEELLRQQRDTIVQGCLTVIYAVAFGVGANQVFQSLIDWKFGWPFWLTLGVWVLFLLYPLYRVLQAQKTKLVVKVMSFRALLLFDQESEHHEPIQMPNYDLSIWANNHWKQVFSTNQQLRQSYFDSEAQQMNVYSYRQDFDYQVQIQYLEYAVLRQFCKLGRSSRSKAERQPRGVMTWLRQVAYPLLLAQRGIQRLLYRFPHWRERYRQANIAAQVAFHFGNYPITSLPDGVRNNVWLQAVHGAQQHYEEHLLAGKDLWSWSFTPFNLAFPFKTGISHQVTDEGRRITFATKYGELSLIIRETGWAKSGFLKESVYYAPKLRPLDHPYRESTFEVTVSFAINQFHGLWPRHSDEFSTYYDWAQAKMQELEDKLSWDKYRTSVMRDDFRRLEHAFGWHDAQAQIEMLHNFPETAQGRAAKYLRWTRSFVWEHRRDGLKGLIDMADEMPNALVEEIILRLLQMSKMQYDDSVTPWRTVEALGVYGQRVRPPLAHRVYERLCEKAQEHLQDRREGIDRPTIGKSLAQMQSVLSNEDQLQNAHQLVQQFLRNPIPFGEEIGNLLWNDSSPNVQQEMLDFIGGRIHAQSAEEKHSGIEYLIALRRQLPLEFRKRILTELVAERSRKLDLRLDTLWVIRSFEEVLEGEEQKDIIRYVLKESRSAHREIREAATAALFFRSEAYSKSDTRTRNAIIRRLITLANEDSDEVANSAVRTLSRYAPYVPRHYQAEVASIFLSRVPPREKIKSDDWLSLDCETGLRALMGNIPDGELKQEIQTALSAFPY
jgi:hypothetical protein